MTTLKFADRVVALDKAFARIPHAFGGAIALAYYAEPRATVDIDLNLFVAVDRYDTVAKRLVSLAIDATASAVREAIASEGQARVMWDGTPVDLFFAYDPFHDAAAQAKRRVPFADQTIPILSATHLMVCKVVFNRSKDWVDIESMLSYDTAVDPAEVLRWVGRIAALLTRR